MLHVNRSLTTIAAAVAAFTLAITIVAAKLAPRAAAEPLLTDGGPLVHGSTLC
jgi:hypothetical protein